MAEYLRSIWARQRIAHSVLIIPRLRAGQYRARGFLTPLVTSLLVSLAAIGAADDVGRQVLDLSGPRWQMEGIRPGQGVREGFFQHFGETASSFYNWNGATVPGDVYTDLWRAGEIDDPHYGRNGMRAKWVLEKEWWYRCQFRVPEDWKGRQVRVVFEGADYSCEVWLNGHYLGRHEGMFSPFEFDVSSILNYRNHHRANGLVVKLDPPPRAYRNVAGRKFGWHGDYWRTLTPIGIWKPVKLVATGPVRIVDVYPKSDIHTDGSATVSVQIGVAGEKDRRASKVRVRAVIRGMGFDAGPFEAESTTELPSRGATATFTIRVPDAKLWWPWEMGQPNRYVVETSVFDESGSLSDRRETPFGIREIRMERNPGYTEQQVLHPWTLVINGKRMFLRSANWGGPPDIFYGRNSEEKYRKLIHLAREANINNLRIFGWHPTEIDAFYDLCDEMGITVWQDLIPLASVRLPEDEAFRKATYDEAIAVMKQLRRHPCLVLLEGGEEMFYGTQGLEYTAEFLKGLEQAIRPYTDLAYVPTSPLNWPPIVHELGLGKPKDSAHTHLLFYAMGARLLEEYIADWDYAVIPEFAVSSAPNVESIRKFIPPDELWPPGPSWGYHWADLDTFRALNDQVLGDERTDSIDRFVEGTQISQGTIFQWGIEHMRRRKPKSSAISICHFITWAPDMKWGIVDYFQLPKRSYDYVRRAYQPLLVSLKIDKRRWLPGEKFQAEVWLVNDLHKAFRDCTLHIQVSDKEGKQLAARDYPIAEIPSDSSARHDTFEWTVHGRLSDAFRVTADLRDSRGRALSSNEYIMLLGDQAKARKDCADRAAQWQNLKAKFPTADYYRFFRELYDPMGSNTFGENFPRADGFE